MEATVLGTGRAFRTTAGLWTLRQDGDAATVDRELVETGPPLDARLNDLLRQLVVVVLPDRLQLERALLGERHRRERQLVGLRHRPEVEVVLGVDARRHVDVELKHLEKQPLQLVPGTGQSNQSFDRKEKNNCTIRPSFNSDHLRIVSGKPKRQ